MEPLLVDALIADTSDNPELDATRLEAVGHDAVWVGETCHDGLLRATMVARATTAATVGTSVAVAFSRSPMTLAYAGHDLARYAEGRFVLGLGSQVKPHIERRFSMPWGTPAARMRELIAAVRAIWSSWQDGAPLSFEGDFYTHTLMTPFFSPPAHAWGGPPIFLAAVGDRMTEVAGEVCDGVFFHAFTTPDYLKHVTMPALTRGRERAGRVGLDGFTVAGPAFATVGRDEDELAAAVRGTKAQLAFYASTPAYTAVLEHHGWAALQPELLALSKQGRWDAMADVIDDEVLHTFSVVGSPEAVADGLRARWAGSVERITLYTPYDVAPGALADLQHALLVPRG